MNALTLILRALGRRSEHALARRFGPWFVNLPLVRDRVPVRYRPALYFDSLYNLGSGAFFALFSLGVVVMTTVLDGSAWHLTVLGAMFGGSSLFSPLVTYCGRTISMRSMIVYPNLIVAGLLCATVLPFGGATLFAFILGSAFLMRVFPRVAEMNMYRALYPATHRGAAVGWLKSLFSLSGLLLTLVGYLWLLVWPQAYAVLYCAVAAVLAGGALCYARIPLRRVNEFAPAAIESPHRAFWRGLRIFLADRRFFWYQAGFAIAGTANHLSMVFIARILREDVLETRGVANVLPGELYTTLQTHWRWHVELDAFLMVMIVGLIVAVLPAVLMILSSPFWGRFLDRVNPMSGRALFNTIQAIAYAFYAYGGTSLQIWPFFAGAALHAIGNGGGTINWLTGSLYFARSEYVSLYNAVHVGLTGLRGMLAPMLGGYLISGTGQNLGAGLFWVSSVFSLLGAAVMLVQGLTDPGPREAVPAAVRISLR